MSSVNNIYKENIALNSNDVDSFNRSHCTTYFNIMQEVAGKHAHQFGMSIPQLLKDDKTWVVTRTKMKIEKWASWPSVMQIETWPQKNFRFYYPRVCRALNENNETLFESISQWVVIDHASQRPVKPQQFKTLPFPENEPITLSPDLGRRVNFNTSDFEKIVEYRPQIAYGDCDLNLHVNNVVYLKWMLDSLSFSFRDTHLVTEVDISYLYQTFRDDKVVVLTGYEKNDESITLYHQINRLLENNETQEVSVAQTKWILASQ